MNRYTGRELTITFNDIVLSGEWNSFEVERVQALVEVTALGEAHQVLRPTVQQGTWKLHVYDRSGQYTSGGAILQQVGLGDSGELVFGPLGNAPDQPKFSFPALITHISQPFEIDQEVLITIGGVMNGAFTEGVFEGP